MLKSALMKTVAGVATVASLASSGVIYPAAMQITDIEDGVKHMQRASGFEYEYEAAEDDFVGDIEACIMFNNGTPETIEDDIVITCRYSGYWVE